MKQVHILNGDASLRAFKAAGLAGEVVIWREILADGPAVHTLPDAEFWQQRAHYITSIYPETPEGYRQKVLNELKKLEQVSKDSEVILWFDGDLICQVNLLYLLCKLQMLGLKHIAVCCPDAKESVAHLQPESLLRVYSQRIHVQPAQIQQAQEIWELYAGNDPLLLQQYLSENKILLPYLKNALLLHLKRFPDCVTGLGHPQQLMLELVQNGITTVTGLMQAFLLQEPGYGFGDWQLQVILRQLQPHYLSSDEPLHVTEQGKELLDQKTKPIFYLEALQWLGGVEPSITNTYCFNKSLGLLEVRA